MFSLDFYAYGMFFGSKCFYIVEYWCLGISLVYLVVDSSALYTCEIFQELNFPLCYLYC